MSKWSGYCLMAFTALSCSVAKYQPNKKYSPQQLQQETDILWQTYQQVHPSYNWYTPADSIDTRFRQVKQSITDSLTEAEFRLRLSWAVAAIRCGHTSVLPPKAAARAASQQNTPSFPLQVRLLQQDSLVVLQNAGPKRDSVNRGVVLTGIDSIPVAVFVRQMQEYISVDGYNNGFAQSQVSTGFAARFKWLYGLKPSYHIQFIDTSGRNLQATIHNTEPRKRDSTRRDMARTREQTRSAVPPSYGFLAFDSAHQFAYLRINSFMGSKVSAFIRKSMRRIDSSGVRHLVLDLRGNSGGRIQKSVLLAKYLSDHPFKVADSVSATGFQFPYARYVQSGWVYQWFSWLFTSKGSDGRLHMRSTERKVYKPKTKHHFDGNIYVLTGGRTFSASVLLLNYLDHQHGLTLVGEETGGGARGNSSVFTPDITLPYTRIRARLPLFRIVSRASLPHNGRGMVPDTLVFPTSADVRAGRDAVVEAVKEKIKSKTTD